MEKNLKNIKAQFKERGVFYTPVELAKSLLKHVDVDYKSAYDPTIGQGNLLSVLPDEVEKFGQEFFESELEKAKKKLKNFKGFAGDTLKEPHFMDRKFDFIFSNPPYSIKWEQMPDDERFSVAPALPPKSKADYAFLLHCLHLLDDNGIAILIMFPGVLYRGNAEGKIRQWLVEQNYISKIIQIEPGYFVDTNIATVAIILKKNKKDNSIEFIDESIGKARKVEFDEIKENDFNLSINTYVQEDIVKEVIDPIALENEIRQNAIKKMRADILRSSVIERLQLDENFPKTEIFIKDLKSAINEEEKKHIKAKGQKADVRELTRQLLLFS